MFVGEVSHSGQVRTTLNSSWRKACRTVLAPGHAVLGSKPPATVRGAGSGTRASRPKRATSSPKEHWGSSGFASTDLEFRSKQQRIMKVIAVGPLANTCIECTSRFAAVLGQQVTLATA